MTTTRLEKAWRILITVLWVALSLYAAFLAYLFFSGAFNNVDGGIGFAAGILYGLVGAGGVGIIYVLRWATRKKHVLNMVTFTLVMTMLLVGALVVSIGLIQSQQQSARAQEAKAALESCAVSTVRWQYSPASTTVIYTDGMPVFEQQGYTDPMVVESLVSKAEARCGSSIEYYVNGELRERTY